MLELDPSIPDAGWGPMRVPEWRLGLEDGDFGVVGSSGAGVQDSPDGRVPYHRKLHGQVTAHWHRKSVVQQVCASL